MAIRVVLLTDSQLVNWGLTKLLETAPGRFRLALSRPVFDATTYPAVGAAVPDIILFDIDGEPAQAVARVTRLVATAPAAKIILLTRLADTALQDRAVIAGARGVLDRTAAPEHILTALTKVYEGQVWLDHAATSRVFVELSRLGSGKATPAGPDKVASLTEREQQIVAFITANSGEPGKTVAAKLCISESTLRNHLTSIYEKLGVANRNGLLAYAFQTGLAERLTKVAS